ncbi:MAG: hypothetical protein P8X74_22170 [Reinekea sp.]
MQIKLLLRALKETIYSCPGYIIAMAAILILIGTMPALNIYFTSQFISLFDNQTPSASPKILLILWGLSMLIPNLLTPLVEYIQANINQLLTGKITFRLMEKSSSFKSLETYDIGEVQNTIEVLSSESQHRPTNFAVNIVMVSREIIAIISISYMLYSALWWAPILLLVSAIPLAIINFKVTEYSWQALMDVGQHSRMLRYLSNLTFHREAQKEVHLFKAFDLISSKYTSSFNVIHEKLKSSQKKILAYPIPFQLISVLGTGSLLYILYRTSSSSSLTTASVVIK